MKVNEFLDTISKSNRMGVECNGRVVTDCAYCEGLKVLYLFEGDVALSRSKLASYIRRNAWKGADVIFVDDGYTEAVTDVMCFDRDIS